MEEYKNPWKESILLVSESTLDEAPMAYKLLKKLLETLRIQ